MNNVERSRVWGRSKRTSRCPSNEWEGGRIGTGMERSEVSGVEWMGVTLVLYTSKEEKRYQNATNRQRGHGTGDETIRLGTYPKVEQTKPPEERSYISI